MRAQIKEVLDLSLHPVKQQHLDVFALMDDRSTGRFRLCLLLLECIHLLESYLNGGGDFGRWATLSARLKHAPIARSRANRLDSLCKSLGYKTFMVSPHDWKGAKLVTQVWESLLNRLPSDEGVGDARTESVLLTEYRVRLPHLWDTTRRISELFRAFPEQVNAFGYHGSIASNDHVQGLSDCDTVIVLRRGVATDPASLQRIRPAFLKSRSLMRKLDFFQHHGIYVLPEELLPYYPEDYFPSVLFQSSTFAIGGGTTLPLQLVGSRWLNLLSVLRSSQYIERVALQALNYSYYMFHYVLQLAQLVPCWVAACCQHPMNKRDAIPWFSERVSRPCETFLGKTAEIRKCWPSIWSPSRMFHGLTSRPSARKLREKTIDFFGGRDQLAGYLRALARDAEGTVLDCMRRSPNVP